MSLGPLFNSKMVVLLLHGSFKVSRDFPGGPVVKNPSCSAGDAGSIPGQGTKIPRATGQISPHAATTEPMHSGARTPQLERSLHTAKERPAHHN